MSPFFILFWSHEKPEWVHSASVGKEGYHEINQAFQVMAYLSVRAPNYVFTVIEKSGPIPPPPG